MSQLQAFILPIIIHAFYTVVLAVRMANARTAAVKSGKVKLRDIALSGANWPDEAKKLSNNFDNQFDMPTAWYAASALILVTAKLDGVFVLLSWVFLFFRLWHSYVHTTSNRLPLRMYVYTGALAALTFMWLWFAWRMFAG